MDEAALADSPPWEPEQYSNDEEEKGENSPSRTNIDDFHSVLTPSADITTQNGYVNQNISKSGIEVSTMSQEVGGLRPSLSPPPSPLYEQFPRNEADLANDWENSQRLDNHGIEDAVTMADSPPWEPDEEEMSTNESTNAASLGMTQRLDSPVLPSSPCLPTHEYDIENHTNDQMDVAIMTDSPPWEPEEMEIPAKNQVPMETSQPEESAAIDQNEKAEESNEVIIEQDTQAIEMEEDGKEPIQQVPGLDETQNLPTQLTTHESEHTDALQPHEAVGAPDEHDLPRSSNTSEESSPPISPENAEEFLTADDNMPKNERRTRFLETSEVIEVERIGTANYAKTQELKKGQGSSGGISKANTEDEDSFDYDNDASILDMSIESFIASQHRESSSSSTSHKKRLSVSGTPRFPGKQLTPL